MPTEYRSTSSWVVPSKNQKSKIPTNHPSNHPVVQYPKRARSPSCFRINGLTHYNVGPLFAVTPVIYLRSGVSHGRFESLSLGSGQLCLPYVGLPCRSLGRCSCGVLPTDEDLSVDVLVEVSILNSSSGVSGSCVIARRDPSTRAFQHILPETYPSVARRGFLGPNILDEPFRLVQLSVVLVGSDGLSACPESIGSGENGGKGGAGMMISEPICHRNSLRCSASATFQKRVRRWSWELFRCGERETIPRSASLEVHGNLVAESGTPASLNSLFRILKKLDRKRSSEGLPVLEDVDRLFFPL